MNKLFKILDGINSSDFAAQTLQSIDEIQNYANGCGESISLDEALKILKVGQEWRDAQKNGNGEWSRMRHDAESSLSE